MSRISRLAILALCASLMPALAAQSVDAQGRGARRPPPPPPQRSVVVRGQVFVGGYFYDPVFGPYPWWTRQAYPWWYFPIYDRRAEVRFRVMPKEAAVYVDGFYAGQVDDFDGTFQSLPLPPGGHRIVLYLDGYRTKYHNVYLTSASTFKLRDTMEPLPAGVTSEPPPVAPAVPPPPTGTYRVPRTGPLPIPPQEGRPGAATVEAAGFGILDVRVLPLDAEVSVDGQRWVSSEIGHFVLHLPAGKHRVEVNKSGHQSFSADIEIADGTTVPLNVSLVGIR